MKRFRSFIKLFLLITAYFTISSGCFLVDDSPLKDGDGKDLGNPKFASGPEYGNYYPFAKGIIDAAGETLGIYMENISTEGSLENAIKLVSGDNYMGNAYMALMQEDVFSYAQQSCETQYDTDPDSVNKNLLKIASQIRVLLALFDEDVHLLVNTDNVTDYWHDGNDAAGADGEITLSDLINNPKEWKINIGSTESGTYITAKNIVDAHSFIVNPELKTDDASTGINKVISGEYDAGFFVTASPSPLFENIPDNTNVKLIPVQMPDAKKSYNENGTIFAGDYPFQENDVSGNITVKTLLVVGPQFNNQGLNIFLDYIFANADEYRSYNHKWSNVALTQSQDYMIQNPQVCNYRAICYVSGFTELDEFYLEPFFYSDYGISAYHEMATEIIWLLSHNSGIDLREKNSTGTWENSYRMLNGNATMALVQDDIFSYLTESNEMYDSMQAASMKKIAPLHYEYLHLLVTTNASNWTQWPSIPSNLEEIFTDPAVLNDSDPELHINVGPKTSGTFITAMQVINSYRSIDNDEDGTPDMDEMEINFYFDSPSDAVSKVENGDYHMMFVVSGVPYHRFYSHDTYTMPTNCQIIPAIVYDVDIDGNYLEDTPYPYREGILHGNGTAEYENYPYPSGILPSDITTLRIRAIQVASPVFDDSELETYIKSIFRKSYYMTYPADPDDLDFVPNPLWISIKKESILEADADYDTYEEDVVGAKEYFVKHPFGWSNEAAKYYVALFPDN